MPRIPVYESQAGIPGVRQQPRADASAFGGDLAGSLRGVGTAVQQIGQSVLQRAEEQDVSDARAKAAFARSTWTRQLYERSQEAEPGDPTFAFKLSEDMSANLEQIAEDLKTRAGRQTFQQLSAQMLGDITERAGIHQAQLAGQKAVNDFLMGLESGRNTLINDPTQFSAVLADGMNALSDARIPASEKQKLQERVRQQLALSAVQGLIRNAGGEVAREQLNAGKWDPFLDADNKAALLGQADQAIRAKEVEAARLKKAQEDALEAEREKTRQDMLVKFVGKQLTVAEVLESNLEAFGEGSKDTFLDMINVRLKDSDKVKSSPHRVMDLFERIHLPEGDPKKLVNEKELYKFFGNGLDERDIDWLRGEIQGARSAEGRALSDMKKQVFNTAKNRLTTSNEFIGIVDPIGDENYSRFLLLFQQEWEREIENGVPAVDLLNPDNPKYIGRHIQQFQRSPQEIIRDQIRQFKQDKDGEGLARSAPRAPGGVPVERDVVPTPSPLPPRKPGETPAEYLERTKGK